MIFDYWATWVFVVIFGCWDIGLLCIQAWPIGCDIVLLGYWVTYRGSWWVIGYLLQELVGYWVTYCGSWWIIGLFEILRY